MPFIEVGMNCNWNYAAHIRIIDTSFDEEKYVVLNSATFSTFFSMSQQFDAILEDLSTKDMGLYFELGPYKIIPFHREKILKFLLKDDNNQEYC